MVYRQKKGRLGYAARPTVTAASVPASVGGINALDSLMLMPPEDCIYTYNLMPVEYGLRLRKGYIEWANGCGTEDVRTILNYESNAGTASQDRLWAVTNEGIWNVTTFGDTSPAKDVTFSTNTDPAGYGVKTEFTADDSTHYMFYADGVNGLHQYKEGTGWSVPVSGTGAGEWQYDIGAGAIGFPVTDVAFVTVHKLRIWVILEDSSDAYYLPIGAIAGTLTKFTFGSKMNHGGNLIGLYSWTIDGGDGIDDYFLAIGRGGDVMVYRGDDPEAIDPTYTLNGTWALTGSWFIGEVPNSRRITAEHGSELYILSTFGITSIRDLLEGTVANSLRKSPSAKINRFLRADVESGKARHEWSLNIHPADGFMQVVTPEPANTPYTQYNQNLSTKAWGIWQDVPMISADTWNGEYMIGGKAGVVWQYTGTQEGTTLAGVEGEAVSYSNLTSFQAPQGDHARFKRVGFVRAIGVLDSISGMAVKAVYDYDTTASVTAPTPAPSTDTNVWGSAVWGTDVWGATPEGVSYPFGALGMGRTVAVATAGSANSRINIVGWDLMYTQGGLL